MSFASPTQVDFLVKRKFRFRSFNYVSACEDNKTQLTYTQSQETIDDAVAYREELIKMSKDEFEKLYQNEKSLEKIEKEEALQAQERQGFFNTKEASADFDFWAKASFWSTEEAIALFFGKNPKIITSKTLEPYLSGSWKNGKIYHISPFAKEFEKTLELAKRAVTWKELHQWMSPISYLHWAKKKGIHYPEELGERVLFYAKGHVTVEDIKKSFEEFKVSTDQRIAQHQQSEQVYLEHIQNLQGKISELESKDKTLSARERESLLKIVLGMAIKGYRYDPQKARNDAVSEICGDLEQLGMSVSGDTIRKYLNVAKEFLSPEAL